MEQTQETQVVAQATPSPEPVAPATENSNPNPFKAQIESAKKEWEEISKPKETEQTPPPVKEEKKETAPAVENKKPLDLKNEAIKKAKAEIVKIKNKMQEFEKQYKDALEKKDEMSAKIITSKYEDLKTELEDKVNESNDAEFRGEFVKAVEADGTVRNKGLFIELADYYIPTLSSNPYISETIFATKYPYATMELLFAEMANKGWSAEKLAEQPKPTLKVWFNAIGKEAEAIVEKVEKPKEVPKSVIATTSSDIGSSPELKTDGASMGDIIKHIRKYGGKGIS